MSQLSRLHAGESTCQGPELAGNAKLAELVSIGYESTGLALFDLLQVAQAQTSFPLLVMGRVDDDSYIIEAVAGLSHSGLRPGTTVDLASRFDTDVVALRAPVSVPDALADEHFAERARRSNVGAYLGVPIMFDDGRLFGTLGGYDSSPRAISKSDIQLFKALARAAAREIEKATGIESLTLPRPFPWQQLAGISAALLELWKELDNDARARIQDAIGHLAEIFGDVLAEPVTEKCAVSEEKNESDENYWPAEVDRVVARAPALLPNLPGPRVRAFSQSGVLVDMESRTLERILANLMLNAWRSAPPNTRITINALRHGDWVEIAVEDQSGLHEEESHPRRLHPAGKGRIGLPIARSLAENAGGSVEQSSTEDGRRYTVRLPVLRGIGDSESIATITPLKRRERTDD